MNKQLGLHIMKRRPYLIFFIVLGLLFASRISAQDLALSEKQKVKIGNSYAWLNLGGGWLGIRNKTEYPSSGIDFSYPALGIDLTFQNKIHVISFKYIYAEEFLVFFRDANNLKGFDLLYGLSYKKTQWYCSLSTGINHSVLTDYNFSPSHIKFYEWGVPIDVQFFLTFNWIGIGIHGFVVLNNEFIYTGGLICLQFGKLR